jgi:hypothetical protein
MRKCSRAGENGRGRDNNAGNVTMVQHINTSTGGEKEND